MKPKTMILMVVAVVCGLGASYMTSRLLAEREDAPAEVAQVKKITLLVAKKKLDIHLPLRDKPGDWIETKEFIDDESYKDALKPEDLPKLKLKFIKREIPKGRPITADDVVDTFGLKIPQGMRAMGIQVNQAQVAGGWASLPGSHVDLVWTSRTGGNDATSKLLLEDVIVLSADGNDNTAPTGAIVANVITVAVTPDNQIKLTLAMETGTLKLGVRGLGDTSTSEKDSYNTGDLHKNRNNKTDAIVAQQVPEIVPPILQDKEVKPPETPPELPQPKAFKRTVTIREGTQLRIHHYWVDEEDRIVAPPASANDNNFDAVPATTGGVNKEDNKKDDNKGGGGR